MCVINNAGRAALFPVAMEHSGRRALRFVVQPRQQRLRGIVRHQVATVTSGSARHVALAVAGVAHHAGEPPRDHVGVAQIGFGEHHNDGAVVRRTAPKSICRIRRLMMRAPSSCARGCAGIEGEARHRQSAAARLASDRRRLRNRARRRSWSAGRCGDRSARRRRSSAACGSDAPRRRAGGSAAARGGDVRGIAGDDLEIGEFVGRLNSCRDGHDDGQIAEARVLGQHGEEGVDHARA